MAQQPAKKGRCCFAANNFIRMKIVCIGFIFGLQTDSCIEELTNVPAAPSDGDGGQIEKRTLGSSSFAEASEEKHKQKQ